MLKISGRFSSRLNSEIGFGNVTIHQILEDCFTVSFLTHVCSDHCGLVFRQRDGRLVGVLIDAPVVVVNFLLAVTEIGAKLGKLILLPERHRDVMKNRRRCSVDIVFEIINRYKITNFPFNIANDSSLSASNYRVMIQG